MRISIIGTGYVGLVTGACFADMGHHVVCYDIDVSKIDQLKAKKIPIYEPGLLELIEKNTDRGCISFTYSIEEALNGCEVCFVCVGTPSEDDGSADLKYVYKAIDVIAQYLPSEAIVVMKSTVPVGTCDRVAQLLSEGFQKRAVHIQPSVVSNPEFLKEGSAIQDFFRPDRIVVGSSDKKAVEIMRKLYKPFIANGHAFLVMDTRSSEMSKYASNCMLATRISFMNEVALICERVGADVLHVRKGVGSDRRIGMDFLYAGIGYGGSCFPKDVRAFIRMGEEAGVDPHMMKATEQVNEAQKNILWHRVVQYFDGAVKGKKLAVWGASFKPNTDDLREAPFLNIAKHLLNRGAFLAVHDPEGYRHVQSVFVGENLSVVTDPYDALVDADALLLVTEWRLFRDPDFERMRALMKYPVVFDGRNQYELGDMKKYGFHYVGIGRGAA